MSENKNEDKKVPEIPETDVEELRKKVEQQAKQIEMLLAVADKGRVFNYENQNADKKKPMKVKLSVFGGGYITGWRTVVDKSIFHPQTGRQVGEEQEYEVLVLDGEGDVKKKKLIGYSAFSDARYGERVECDVVGRKEDWNGGVSFDVQLPDGRTVSLAGQFVN